MATGIKSRSKKKPKLLRNEVDLRRGRQMHFLLARYSNAIDTGNFTLLYTWHVSYFDMLPGFGPELHLEPFECFTNNIAFAAMIFEGAMLHQGRVVTISKMEFLGLTHEIFEQ